MTDLCFGRFGGDAIVGVKRHGLFPDRCHRVVCVECRCSRLTVLLKLRLLYLFALYTPDDLFAAFNAQKANPTLFVEQKRKKECNLGHAKPMMIN
jgi:hypothetical protein